MNPQDLYKTQSQTIDHSFDVHHFLWPISLHHYDKTGNTVVPGTDWQGKQQRNDTEKKPPVQSGLNSLASLFCVCLSSCIWTVSIGRSGTERGRWDIDKCVYYRSHCNKWETERREEGRETDKQRKVICKTCIAYFWKKRDLRKRDHQRLIQLSWILTGAEHILTNQIKSTMLRWIHDSKSR